MAGDGVRGHRSCNRTRATRDAFGAGQARAAAPAEGGAELEARLLLEVGAGDHRAIHITVAELLERWLEHAGPDLSPSTVHGYRLYIDRNIVPKLGHVRVDKLTIASAPRLMWHRSLGSLIEGSD